MPKKTTSKSKKIVDQELEQEHEEENITKKEIEVKIKLIIILGSYRNKKCKK